VTLNKDLWERRAFKLRSQSGERLGRWIAGAKSSEKSLSPCSRNSKETKAAWGRGVHVSGRLGKEVRRVAQVLIWTLDGTLWGWEAAGVLRRRIQLPSKQNYSSC
jgi:hypothetical protein